MPELDINEVLQKDTIRVPGQEYAIISVISPKTRQKYDDLAIKIRGVFKDIDQAKSHAAKLQKADSMFDIYVVEMYGWLLLPPNNENIEETNYADAKLDELIKSHDKEIEDARLAFEEHKKEQKEAGKLQIKNIMEQEEPKTASQLSEVVEETSKNLEETSKNLEETKID
jgi:hypothetical protein